MKKMTDIFKALGDETRLRIFLLLVKDELCVCELVDILKMEQSRISHNLKILKNAGLINCKREGKWMIYYIKSEAEEYLVIIALKKEAFLSEEDKKAFEECKSANIRQACKVE